VSPSVDPVCGAFTPAQANQLFSITALGQSCLALSNPTATCNAVSVTANQVRFILNASTAQQVFGTPFGNSPRNPVQDAVTNIANMSLFKRFKISERASFEFQASALNVFNHNNFSSVDPFLEDAGLTGSFTGFGDPSLTGSVPGVVNVTANRKITIGGVLRF